MLNIAINGFGRIGRTLVRSLLTRTDSSPKLNIVAINCGPDDPARLAHLLAYDTTMGPWQEKVSYQNGVLHCGSTRIQLLSELNPAQCDWGTYQIDWVLEASGRFTSKQAASAHITAGARKVLICAPGNDVDRTIVFGINHETFDPTTDTIISLASCTTNCLAPIIEVLRSSCGIVEGMMTSVHAYTSDQRLLDNDHKDLRRARAAAQNIIPTKTGASKAITALYPELKDKIHGIALRVPTHNVSLVDFSFTMKHPARAAEINAALKQASVGSLQGVLAYTELPLVSNDFMQHSASSIADGLLTATTGSTAKVCAWYDNEFGYCQRIIDFLLHNNANLG